MAETFTLEEQVLQVGDKPRTVRIGNLEVTVERARSRRRRRHNRVGTAGAVGDAYARAVAAGRASRSVDDVSVDMAGIKTREAT